MKRIIYVLTLLFCFIPIINAEVGIDKYKIDVTVLENGNLHILEAFELNGQYNGFERIIKYQGSYSGYQGNSLSSTGDIAIYNASNVSLKEIRAINFSDNFDDIKNSGEVFNEVVSASKGDYGVYTISNISNGYSYMIYNPAKYNKGFYLEYELEDMVIIHNDVAEVGYNVFTQMTEDIGLLEIYVHIPNNEDLLRVWAHGPLNGNTKIIDNQTLLITVENLGSNEAVDTRFVFDKDISSSTKTTNIDALDTIINIETQLAEEANLKRKEVYEELQSDALWMVELVKETPERYYYDRAIDAVYLLNNDDPLKKELLDELDIILEEIVKIEKEEIKITNTVCGTYLLILGLMIYYIYNKHDKEYQTEFKGQYFRDIPSETSPSTVGYLMRKRINNDDLSASILDLISRKIIIFEEIEGKTQNFLFKKTEKENLSELENKLLKFLFEEDDEITLKKLKKRAKSDNSSFIKLYNSWEKTALKEAKEQKFYEQTIFYQILGICCCFIGFSIVIACPQVTILFVLSILSSIAATIYFCLITKRTENGNIEYEKWNGLKKFMEDFGKMDDKELPEIVLWEKYLVYATTLGCADKLSKTMKLKIKKMNEQVLNDDIAFNILYYNNIISASRMISRSVSTVMNTATANSVSSTNYSSGGGHGGGFSGGGFSGGGFSGGGGGGRF